MNIELKKNVRQIVHFFQKTEVLERKHNLIFIGPYLFAIFHQNANVERIFLLIMGGM